MNSRAEPLAQNILNGLIELGMNDRGVRTANFYVLRNTNMPATLIELGFLSNYNDEAYISDEYNQSLIAERVAYAINEYNN